MTNPFCFYMVISYVIAVNWLQLSHVVVVGVGVGGGLKEGKDKAYFVQSLHAFRTVH